MVLTSRIFRQSATDRSSKRVIFSVFEIAALLIENVDLAEPCYRLIDHRLHVALGRDVDCYAQRRMTGIDQRAGRILRAGNIGNDDGGAVRCKALRNGKPDTGAAARHDRHLILEFHARLAAVRQALQIIDPALLARAGRLRPPMFQFDQSAVAARIYCPQDVREIELACAWFESPGIVGDLHERNLVPHRVEIGSRSPSMI